MPVHSPEVATESSESVAQRTALFRRKWQRVFWILFLCLAVLLLVAALMLAFNWPFTRGAVISSLEQDSQAHVQIGAFRETYFPHPGCIAENVTFERGSPSPHLAVRRLLISGSYLGLLHRYIPNVVAEGAVLTVPAGALKELFADRSPGQRTTGTIVGELDAPGAQVSIARDGNQPLVFLLHDLKLQPLAKGSAVRFAAQIGMPEPQGDLVIQGHIGPFRRGDAASAPLSGNYQFTDARLDQFAGVGGTLTSAGKFSGQIRAISLDGTTETPDFQLDVGVHPVPLETRFHAVVNGTNGDLALDPVEALLGKTTILTRATIQGATTDKAHKTVVLDMVSRRGRVEDLLRLFVHDEQSPMVGAISFRGHVVLPPDDRDFLQKVKLQGTFGIGAAEYTDLQTQRNVEILSARARGEADKIEDDQDRDRKHGTDTVDRDLDRVVSNMKGRFVLQHAVATFSDLSFDVPGASARMSGTYNVQNLKIDMQGTLRMQSKLPDTTTGVKSFLLRIVAPLTHRKKEKQGSIVHLHVTGKYGHPQFAVSPIAGGQ
jgi:hypothetical protein